MDALFSCESSVSGSILSLSLTNDAWHDPYPFSSRVSMTAGTLPTDLLIPHNAGQGWPFGPCAPLKENVHHKLHLWIIQRASDYIFKGPIAPSINSSYVASAMVHCFLAAILLMLMWLLSLIPLPDGTYMHCNCSQTPHSWRNCLTCWLQKAMSLSAKISSIASCL